MRPNRALVIVMLCLLSVLIAPPASLHADGPSSTVVYVVRFGDTLSGIAKAFGTSAQAIAARNSLRNLNHIWVGQRLVIATSAPAAPPTATSVYVVQWGDTLSAIAYTQQTTVAALVRANGLLNANRIYIGQRLIIPRAAVVAPSPSTTAYAVQSGDTLSGIAAKFGVSPAALLIANNLRNANMIFTGQVLIIPGLTMRPPSNEPPPSAPPAEPPSAPPVTLQPAVCNPLVSISWPRMHETVGAGMLQIKGSASLPAGFNPASGGFSFYKVEYGVGERPILFFVIGSLHYSTVSDGVLETWDTSVLPDGVYILRLTVVDTLGQFPAPCETRVTVKH